MTAFLDVLDAARELLRADLSPSERAELEAKRDSAAAIVGLNTPVESPLKVYHPKQVETRREKDSGDAVFLRAHGTV
jgi:hypothetical protein